MFFTVSDDNQKRHFQGSRKNCILRETEPTDASIFPAHYVIYALFGVSGATYEEST